MLTLHPDLSRFGQFLYTNVQADRNMSNILFLSTAQQKDIDEMELLVSKEVESSSPIAHLSHRMRMYMALLVFGVLGVMGCAFTMSSIGVSLGKPLEFGIERIASSHENVLALLAFPVFLFLILFVAFTCLQTYKEYRSVYNPKNYGRSKKRSAV